jgi:autotransporter passenger strand-loop-strand repeat protein
MSRVSVSKGATLELVGGTTIPQGGTLASGAILAFASGAVLNSNTVSGGSTIFEVLAGGTDLSAAVVSGGTLLVGPGGFASGTAVGEGGVEIVLAGG